MTRPAVVTTPGEIVQPATLQKESRFSDIFPVEVIIINLNKKIIKIIK